MHPKHVSSDLSMWKCKWLCCGHPVFPHSTSKATLQILENALQTLSGNSLKDFLVPERYLKDLLQTPIPDLPTVISPDIDDRFTLRIVSWLGNVGNDRIFASTRVDLFLLAPPKMNGLVSSHLCMIAICGQYGLIRLNKLFLWVHVPICSQCFGYPWRSISPKSDSTSNLLYFETCTFGWGWSYLDC